MHWLIPILHVLTIGINHELIYSIMYLCVCLILQEIEAIQDVKDSAHMQRGLGIMAILSLGVAAIMFP